MDMHGWKQLKPGDRVVMNDGKVGTVVVNNGSPIGVFIEWDDGSNELVQYPNLIQYA